jgi:2',3'-cyclic-nucleotide 2'-phosphodiesterase (5'-nucleotidase family)
VTTGNSHIDTIKYLDVMETAKLIYKELQSKVDFTVLLASVFNPDAENLKNGQLQYDLIIRSHSPRLSRTLTTAGDGFLLSTGTLGRYVQVLEIRRNSATSEIPDLSLTMQRLSFIESRLNEFKQQAGDRSVKEYYQDREATYEFIKNLQKQHSDLKQEVRSADNYAAVRLQALGTQIPDNEHWQEQVNKMLN